MYAYLKGFLVNMALVLAYSTVYAIRLKGVSGGDMVMLGLSILTMLVQSGILISIGMQNKKRMMANLAGVVIGFVVFYYAFQMYMEIYAAQNPARVIIDP